jgi:kynurenine formamidase
VEDNSERCLLQKDILEHEAVHGTLPAGCVVLVYTGWSRRYLDGSLSYMGIALGEYDSPADPNVAPPLRFPGISADAATLLVERHIAGVGLDTPSLDAGSTGYGKNASSFMRPGFISRSVSSS